jgi:hypothetical protein
MRWRTSGTGALVVGVGLCAASMLSCGGPASESLTSPSVATLTATADDASAVSSAVSDEAGGVTADCNNKNNNKKVVVCHKGHNLSVSSNAVSAHLRHGDSLGECSSAAHCPCFSQQGIEELAATCSAGLVAQCDVQYSLQLYCSPGPFSSNLGYFEAQVGRNSCVSITQDEVTGDLVRTERSVNNSQYQACKDALVSSAPYQSTDAGICPR